MTTAKLFDQYYTQPQIAKECINTLMQFLREKGAAPEDYRYIEPSAGTGSFSDILIEKSLNTFACDIDPQKSYIQKVDFLKLDLSKECLPCIGVGNPPFGKNSSLAIKFFNRLAMVADIIAFIVPLTFRKASCHNKLNKNFHLKIDIELPISSFEFEGASYSVPCCFQVWERSASPRTPPVLLSTPDLVFTVDRSKASVLFQRVGVNAGNLKLPCADVSLSSHYGIIANSTATRILASIDWSSIKRNTAGCPSISKQELISAYLLAKRDTSCQSTSN